MPVVLLPRSSFRLAAATASVFSRAPSVRRRSTPKALGWRNSRVRRVGSPRLGHSSQLRPASAAKEVDRERLEVASVSRGDGAGTSEANAVTATTTMARRVLEGIRHVSRGQLTLPSVRSLQTVCRVTFQVLRTRTACPIRFGNSGIE